MNGSQRKMAMDKTLFYREMARMSVAWNRMADPALLDTYWNRLQNHSDEAFVAAVNRLIDTEEKFPTVAALKNVMRTAADIGRRQPAVPTAHAPKLYASDLNVPRKPKKTPHAVGSAGHRMFLRNSSSFMANVERILTERMKEMDTNADPDLERRVGVLSRTLARQDEWHRHFELTGESLVEEEPKGGNKRRHGCQTCNGAGIVRKDLPIHDPDFGKAFLCPDCRGGGPALKNGGH
jgi:hypothetical protein